jgi:hypothetical protein
MVASGEHKYFEDLSAEPDAWEYDADGSIRITGTSLTVPARPADPV